MLPMNTRCCHLIVLAGVAASLLPAARIRAADDPAPKKKTLAVLPFIYSTAAEKNLAERMRFAVSAKLSRDGNVDRTDTVEVDQTLSALQIPWSTEMPAEDDIAKAIDNLGVDEAITGGVSGRTLTLHLYVGDKLTKTSSVEIPGDADSLKLAVEHILTDLTHAQFQHMRLVECDHSNPAIETLWRERPNLAPDPGFEDAAVGGAAVSDAWTAVLGANEYHPRLIATAAAAALPKDKVAIVPKSFATGDPSAQGHCLMMRMSLDTAQSNGLACVSTWIPVDDGKMYRFTCKYHSKGPTLHLFLNGFAFKPDKFGDKSDLEAVRRQAYRYQVVPRGPTKDWTLIEADFTPSAAENKLNPEDRLKIEWMRLDLYVYLGAGDVFFDDVTLKKIAP
jgi:hypothetical protein